MDKYSKIKSLCADLQIKVLEGEKLSDYTSFRIGGEVPLMVVPKTTGELKALIPHLKEVPFFILGKGSNLLIDDEGIDAVCVLISGEFSNYEIMGDTLICDAGMPLSKACLIAAENSLSGLEFAYGIPGTVGGGAYMNAGAYGGELKDVITYCEHIDFDGNEYKLENRDLDFSYRHSYYVGKDFCITKVAMKLKKGDKKEITDKMTDILSRRRDKQPLDYPSAGSTFKRPEGAFAAALIEECNLKGKRVGGAMVSKKHSGFIINYNNATCKDVISLIKEVKEIVKKEKGFTLCCEVMTIKSDGKKTYSVAVE